MSKMSDMAMTIKELRNAAAAINEAADWLAEQFSDSIVEASNSAEKKPELKLENVRAVLAEKSRVGFTAGVRTLLEKYGAKRLSEVDSKYYEALLKDAEVLGNAT